MTVELMQTRIRGPDRYMMQERKRGNLADNPRAKRTVVAHSANVTSRESSFLPGKMLRFPASSPRAPSARPWDSRERICLVADDRTEGGEKCFHRTLPRAARAHACRRCVTPGAETAVDLRNTESGANKVSASRNTFAPFVKHRAGRRKEERRQRRARRFALSFSFFRSEPKVACQESRLLRRLFPGAPASCPRAINSRMKALRHALIVSRRNFYTTHVRARFPYKSARRAQLLRHLFSPCYPIDIED